MSFQMMTVPSSKVLDLRNLLAERFPRAQPSTQTHLATGLPALDGITEGGLLRGAITELISPQLSAGSASLIHHLLASAERERQFLALIDGRDSFDPQPCGNERLRHLFWIRCRKTLEALKAADFLLRDGNFPMVILDLVLNPEAELRKIPQSSWYRLQRLVEPMPTAFLILTRQSMISSARLKLVLENCWRLPDLTADDPFARLQFRVQRSQGTRVELAG